MKTSAPTMAALSDHLLGVFPTLDATDRVLSFALYRLLANGGPVAIAALARKVGISVNEATRRLQSWPGLYYDGEQRVIGYWGIALGAMSHHLRVNGRVLYAWCAWDTLFLPAVLGQRAEVKSVCRGSRRPVQLSVGPNDVEAVEPAGLVVSFLLPDVASVRADVIASFATSCIFFARRKTRVLGWRSTRTRFSCPLPRHSKLDGGGIVRCMARCWMASDRVGPKRVMSVYVRDGLHRATKSGWLLAGCGKRPSEGPPSMRPDGHLPTCE